MNGKSSILKLFTEKSGHRLKAALKHRNMKCARERGSNVPGWPRYRLNE